MDVSAITSAVTVATRKAATPPPTTETPSVKGDEVKLSTPTSGLKATGIGFAAGVTTSAILATTTVRVFKGGGMAAGLGALYLAGDSIIGGLSGGPVGALAARKADSKLKAIAYGAAAGLASSAATGAGLGALTKDKVMFGIIAGGSAIAGAVAGGAAGAMEYKLRQK